MTIIYILIAIFIITGIILIFQALGLFEKNNIKHINSNISKNSPNTIENNINVLDGNSKELQIVTKKDKVTKQWVDNMVKLADECEKNRNEFLREAVQYLLNSVLYENFDDWDVTE